MKEKKVRVFAPASVSNVGPGFDLMGFALNGIGDEIELSFSKENSIRITKIVGENGKLPYDPQKNTATVAIESLLTKHKISVGLDVKIIKKMGIGSGLGSSAASAVAAVVAANELLELNFTKHQLLEHAVKGEMAASQALHADNVAPCLFGGFVLIRGYNPIDIVQIDYPKNLFCTIIYPQIEIKTSDARKILDKKVDMKTAVAQAGNAAGLIAGLLTKDFSLISRSIIDLIAEPKRAALIPCYNEVREAALSNGAINCNITGSGPSMFAFSNSKAKAKSIANAMKKAATKKGLQSKIYISKINDEGPLILK
ncbi:homoserine kinase [Melioribacteraceae bacterium 4301-Me]|uniref:homoserine kinase n=1 Tax=Pyranulibacter aquaticus TaxID=3163344 RepID=UPI00359A9DAA